MENSFIISFFLVNALFWSLFPHSAHCSLLRDFNKMIGTNIKCPTHSVHIFMGIIFFLITIYFAQKKYIHKQFV